jgi:hypothetical protein
MYILRLNVYEHGIEYSAKKLHHNRDSRRHLHAFNLLAIREPKLAYWENDEDGSLSYTPTSPICSLVPLVLLLIRYFLLLISFNFHLFPGSDTGSSLANMNPLYRIQERTITPWSDWLWDARLGQYFCWRINEAGEVVTQFHRGSRQRECVACLVTGDIRALVKLPCEHWYCSPDLECVSILPVRNLFSTKFYRCIRGRPSGSQTIQMLPQRGSD